MLTTDKIRCGCRFLQLAEMMKPSSPGTGAQSGPNGFVSASDETLDYFPHIGDASLYLKQPLAAR